MGHLKFHDTFSRPPMSDRPFPPRPKQKTAEDVTEKVYELKLHERTDDLSGRSIVRVPGGWIYNDKVFVPFDNEGNLKL